MTFEERWWLVSLVVSIVHACVYVMAMVNVYVNTGNLSLGVVLGLWGFVIVVFFAWLLLKVPVMADYCVNKFKKWRDR